MSGRASRGIRRRAGGVAALMAATLLLAGAAWALRMPGEAQPARVQVYLLWNQDYLCLAAKVPDAMLTGSNAGPMSSPEEDDALEFDLGLRGRGLSQAHRLIISAAGGMAVLTRDARGQWRTDPSWISGPQMLKYAVTLNGTLNRPTDTDEGFVVECAIPWRLLGGEPPLGAEIGLNVVVWMQGESEGLASWATGVTSAGDLSDPRRWGRMVIAGSTAQARAEGRWAVCPYVGRMPFIDGKLAADEWLTAGTLAFDKPAPTLTPAPTPEAGSATAGLLLAIYRYDWQGALARPGAPLWLPDGRPATVDQPQDGAGLWQSWERVAWHRAHLEEIQRAGIDIILAHYRGDGAARRSWARAGLDRLGEALKELRAEGRGYPLVGMMLDTGPLRGADLTRDEGKRFLYGMVRDFFLHVPREFWAQVGPGGQAGPGGVPVLLGEPKGLADWDGGFLTYCQERFREEFGGPGLTWLGSAQWRTRGADGFYAYVRLPESSGLAQEAVGGARAVSISPGWAPAPGEHGEVRSRRDGRAYRADWQRALALAPELVVLDSWNDFAHATELAPSRQYGVAYVDQTRFFSARLSEAQPYRLRMKQQSAPEVMAPGADYEVELVVENVGTEDIVTGARITADHRLVRRADGKVMRSVIGAQALRVLAGQTLRLPVTISTRDDRGDPLAPGQYLFTLIVMRSRVAYLRSQWVARPVAELTIPITVGTPPPHRASIISTSLPSSIEPGATEQVMVRLRNDGAQTWRPGEVALSYRWLRHDDEVARPEGGPRVEAVAEGGRALLPREVRPGETVSVMIALSAVLSDGSPLPPAGPDDLWHYRLAWDLVGPEGRFSGDSFFGASEAIQVVAHDRGVRFGTITAPATLQAGQTVAVEAEVHNAGARTWEAARSQLLARWHRWDGRPSELAPASAPLPADLVPGRAVRLSVSVTAPDHAGPWWLVWDMVVNGGGIAEAGGGRGTDLVVSPVTVTGGGFRPVELSRLANVTAISDDTHRARGDFDGLGRSLPAEWLAQRAGAADRLWPSGAYAPSPGEPVPFLLPDMASGVAGAVACDGQLLALGSSPVRRSHLLLASASEGAEVGLRVTLADGSTDQVAVMAPAWTDDPLSHPGRVGLYAPYVRALTGDDAATPVALYHAVVTSSRGAMSVELPRRPAVKLLAVTVEE